MAVCTALGCKVRGPMEATSPSAPAAPEAPAGPAGPAAPCAPSDPAGPAGPRVPPDVYVRPIASTEITIATTAK